MSSEKRHRKAAHIANRARIVYLAIPALMIAIILVVGIVIAGNIMDDATSRMSRQYSIEAAANFQTSTNPHFVLAQQLARSTTISRWMAHGHDEEIRARAIEEIVGYVKYTPYVFLMFSSYISSDVYDLRVGFTEEDFVPWWQIATDRDFWFFNTRDAQLPFNLNIQRSRPVDGHFSVYVWTNHRMYYNDDFVGVVTAGSPFQPVFEAIFSDFEESGRRGYIIDYGGLARADSAEQLKVLDDGMSNPAVIPEAHYNVALADGINAHLQTMEYGAFPMGANVGEAIPVRGDFRYASIAPIIGTNWSMVVLSESYRGFVLSYVPLLIVTVILLASAVLLGSMFVRKTVLTPLKKLAQSTSEIGENFEADIYGMGREDEIGDISHAISNMLQRIGEFQEKEREANEALLEAIHEGTRAKDRFLARMSHELRTPLTAVLGVSELQLRGKSLPLHIEEAFSEIYSSGKTLLNIVNDILDFSMIEAGKMKLKLKEYDVASLVSDAAQLQLHYSERKDIQFDIHVDENLPSRLVGDVLRIRQMMTNLLANAFKFTESGGIKLSIYAENETKERITLVISIKDTGVGMTEEQVKRIYGGYVNLYGKDESFVAGTGLGIPIVHSLAELMNAEFILQSSPGEGTCTTLRIPQEISGAEVLGRELAQRLQNFDSRTKSSVKSLEFVPEQFPDGKVLVVDDVEINLYVASAMLKSFGLTVDLCESGKEAVDRIKKGKEYDIIFMDHMMPGIDGIEATNILREMGYKKPIVALTANAIKGQSEVFMKNGFSGVITKPIDIELLNSYLVRFVK